MEALADAEPDAIDSGAPGKGRAIGENGDTAFAAHAAAFREAPITPELNALEIVPLDGIRDKKVREIRLEVRYSEMSEEGIKHLREIFEDNVGEIPVSIHLVEVPESLGGSDVRLRLNHHFRVQPGPPLNAALEKAKVKAAYFFGNPNGG
jgi:hypothetical protein